MITKPDYAVSHIKHEKVNYAVKDPSYLKQHDKDKKLNKKDQDGPQPSLISLVKQGKMSITKNMQSLSDARDFVLRV
jgi:hypothetical protein